MDYYVFLDDRETYSRLDGCAVIGIADGNTQAADALFDERFDDLLVLADKVIDLVAPLHGEQLRLPFGEERS